MPLGPRRHYYVEHVKGETITKSEVDDILFEGTFICTYRMDDETANHDYEGCLNNLHMILHDGETRVRVVGSRSKDYKSGYRTVVMTAPCFPATFIIRTEE